MQARGGGVATAAQALREIWTELGRSSRHRDGISRKHMQYRNPRFFICLVLETLVGCTHTHLACRTISGGGRWLVPVRSRSIGSDLMLPAVTDHLAQTKEE
jgi:hypothetical protein